MDAPGAVRLDERLRLMAESIRQYADRQALGPYAMLRQVAVTLDEMAGEPDGSWRGWRGGRPPDHGYFLAAWRRGDGLAVSELWFNPDSLGSGWWPGRGYLHERAPSEPLPVVAWMPMPAPPVETPR